jgi:hypothetical protein
MGLSRKASLASRDHLWGREEGHAIDDLYNIGITHKLIFGEALGLKEQVDPLGARYASDRFQVRPGHWTWSD